MLELMLNVRVFDRVTDDTEREHSVDHRREAASLEVFEMVPFNGLMRTPRFGMRSRSDVATSATLVSPLMLKIDAAMPLKNHRCASHSSTARARRIDKLQWERFGGGGYCLRTRSSCVDARAVGLCVGRNCLTVPWGDRIDKIVKYI